MRSGAIRATVIRDDELITPSAEAVMFAVPSARGVKRPFWSMVPTFSLSLAQMKLMPEILFSY